jgi:predicted transcriptional regulator
MKSVKVTGQATGQVTGQATGEATGEVSGEVLKVILVLEGEMKLSEIMSVLSLKHREFFTDNYIEPAIKQNIIEQTYPESPNHPQQRYKLTEKGLQMKLKIKTKK